MCIDYDGKDYLAHYGVKGMRWRKGRKTPYELEQRNPVYRNTYYNENFGTSTGYVPLQARPASPEVRENSIASSVMIGKTIVASLKNKSYMDMEEVAKSTEDKRKQLFRNLGASKRAMQ